MIARFLLSATLLLTFGVSSIYGYAASSAIPAGPSFLPRTNPLEAEGLKIDLPDFNELFARIQEVSPLARQAISGATALANGMKGLASVNDKDDGDLRWKRLERNPRGPVHQIDKMDHYNGKSTPILRFRSSLKGPLADNASILGPLFGRYIIDLEERKKWDAQIEQVFDIQTVSDPESTNLAMGLGQYGDCSRIGIGYGQTKKALGITPREQLYLYGLQDFKDGSCVMWGTDLDEKHNHLLPGAKRHTRAKSHLFSATLMPTGEDSFDIEYVLQLCIGGSVPTWLTTPVMIDTVKNLFRVAEKEFSKGVDNFMASFLKDDQKKDKLDLSLLMAQ